MSSVERILYYKIMVPPKTGEKPTPLEVEFDPLRERTSILKELDIDPNLTDKQLEEEGYKTALMTSFRYFTEDSPTDNYVPVVEWIKRQTELREQEFILTQKELDGVYRENLVRWETGYEVTSTVVCTPESESSIRTEIEKNPNFLEWVSNDLSCNHDYTLNEEMMADYFKDRPAVEYDSYVLNIKGQQYTVMFFLDSTDDREYVMAHEGFVKQAEEDDLDFNNNMIITVNQLKQLDGGSSMQEKFLGMLELEDVLTEEDAKNHSSITIKKTERDSGESRDDFAPAENVLEFRNLEEGILDKLSNLQIIPEEEKETSEDTTDTTERDHD